VILKPATAFIGDWINQHYATSFTHAFALENFTFEIIELASRNYCAS
jgi:hypothetical protein